MNDDQCSRLHSHKLPPRAVSHPVPGLGPLESAIMLALWDAAEPLKVAEVAQCMDYQRDLAYTTVMTVLTILCSKGLAWRSRDRYAWRYAPALSRDGYLTEQVQALIVFARDPESVVRDALGRAAEGSQPPGLPARSGLRQHDRAGLSTEQGTGLPQP